MGGIGAGVAWLSLWNEHWGGPDDVRDGKVDDVNLVALSPHGNSRARANTPFLGNGGVQTGVKERGCVGGIEGVLCAKLSLKLEEEGALESLALETPETFRAFV